MLLRVLLIVGAIMPGARADWPFPVSDGTTWRYSLTREPEQDRMTLTRRVVASRKTPNVSLEEAIDGTVRWTGLLTSKDGAVLVTSVRDPKDKIVPGSQPATLLPAKLEAGTSWNFRGQIAGSDVALPVKIVGADEIEVAAGKFRAWHIRGEQAGMVTTSVEQWFAPGVGWVKETVTQRSPTGQLIARHSAELVATPSVGRDQLAAETKPFEASLSTSTAGAPMDTVSADALQIVARWRARPTLPQARVRAVWIAEETGGIAPPGYQIDEATAFAAPPESVGIFTLSRPADGWAPGRYRVDFYLQDVLVASARVRIAPRAVAAEPMEEF